MCIVKLGTFLSEPGKKSLKCPKIVVVLFPVELKNNETRWRNNVKYNCCSGGAL